MKIEIVTHVFCPVGIDFYAECLKWQWASLINYSCEHVVDYTVFYTSSDTATIDQLETCDRFQPENVYLRPVELPPQQLFRRSIGRNIRALNTDADIVWFTDVDYLFGGGCLDGLATIVSPDDPICCPESYWINIDHETGDRMLDEYRTVDLPRIPRKMFVERKQKLAIGGLQIVGGNTIRKTGYLKDNIKYQTPVTVEKGFRSCKCDRVFRKESKLPTIRVSIPEIYRIRHSVDGRDFYANGSKGVGKEAW